MAQRAGESERADFAKQHADALAPTLATLTITAPHAPAGLQITRDGTVLDKAALNVAVPVNPGAHSIQASAPDKKPLTMTIIVPKGAAQTLALPPLRAHRSHRRRVRRRARRATRRAVADTSPGGHSSSRASRP